ncbi:MAG: type II toxin-antitoxin system HicB family antitoxin [Thermoguttaceae bacterium]
MTEIVFQVEDDPEGGYTAKALGAAICTQADSLEELRTMIRDAVCCHFENSEQRPKMIRLHFCRDEVIVT